MQTFSFDKIKHPTQKIVKRKKKNKKKPKHLEFYFEGEDV